MVSGSGCGSSAGAVDVTSEGVEVEAEEDASGWRGFDQVVSWVSVL